jgi:hypothetical protein
MRSAKALLALVLTLGFVGSAGAVTHKSDDLGSLSSGEFGFIGNGFGDAGSFSDVVNFSLTGQSTLSGYIADLGVDAGFALIHAGSTIATGPFATDQYSFADLAPGNYSLSIFGTNSTFGGYIASYNVAAVPEAETWLMIVIGLGLVAFQLQRKQRSLRHQSLSPA